MNLVSPKSLSKNIGKKPESTIPTRRLWRDFFGDVLSSIFAWIFFSFLRFRREVTLKNLSLVFPDRGAAELKKLGRLSYWHFIRNTYDFILGYTAKDFLRIRVVGDEIVCKELSREQGLIILCAHLGNFELQAASTSIFFRKAYAFVKKIGGRRVNHWVQKKREGHGYYPIVAKTKGEGARRLIEILQRNEILGFMMDQSRPSSPLVKFFGQDAKTNVFLARWLLKHPTPVVPSYCIRLEDGSHELVFLEPVKIELGSEQSQEQQILSIAKLLNHELERMILKAPEQYFWMHRRWKNASDV